MEARREYHERHAAAEKREAEARFDSSLAEHSQLLDEAIARLSGDDRAGVLLSYFDQKTFREVGKSLGVSEEAARKRVGRAVQKMRSFFASRGITVDGAAIASMAAIGAPVPAILSASVLSAAHGAAGAASSLSIVKGVNHMIALAKLKLAAACVAGCVIIGGGSAAIVAQTQSGADKPAQQSVQPDAKSTAKTDISSAKFDDGVTVEIAGLSKNEPDAQWWHADGSSAEKACDQSTSNDSPVQKLAICLRVAGVPEDAGIVWLMPANTWSSQPATKDGTPLEHTEIMTFNPNEDAIDVRCRVATGTWENAFQNEGADNSSCGSSGENAFAISAAIERDGKTVINATVHTPNSQMRLIAVDSNGAEHTGSYVFSGSSQWFTMVTVSFDIPLTDLARAVVQTRPYDHTVEFKHVTMDPAKKTQPVVTATKS